MILSLPGLPSVYSSVGAGVFMTECMCTISTFAACVCACCMMCVCKCMLCIYACVNTCTMLSTEKSIKTMNT